MPSAFWQATGLLTVSNIFMTFAWYAHLKELNDKPWYFAALVSWGIASSSTCSWCRPTVPASRS
jgi:uncharacterized protein (DUF486 family)